MSDKNAPILMWQLSMLSGDGLTNGYLPAYRSYTYVAVFWRQ
jgi:hypothetical protein